MSRRSRGPRDGHGRPRRVWADHPSRPDWAAERRSLTGAEDNLATPAYARTYVDAAVAAGGRAELVLLPDVGHWDVVTVATPTWQIVTARIAAALGAGRKAFRIPAESRGPSTFERRLTPTKMSAQGP